MKEEVLKYLADGHTKTDTMAHFGLSRYRLAKVLKEDTDCYDGFVREFVSANAEVQNLRMVTVYKVYCGWCKEHDVEPGNVRGLVTRILTACNLNVPPAVYYDILKSKNDVRLLVKTDLTPNKLKYYENSVTNNMLRNNIAAEFSDEFDVDSISLLLGDMTLADFIAKWKDIRSLYNKEITPTKASVKEEKVEAAPAVYNDATSYVEEKMKDRKFTSFKALRKMFEYTSVNPLTVNTVLCGDRHDVGGIVQDLNTKPIFSTLLGWQKQDAEWMERTASAWIDQNIKFDKNGNALQKLRVYTTGYNPLNMTVAKVAMQRNINFNALYYNPTKNEYWEQEIINSFPLEQHPLSKFVESGDYYMYGDFPDDKAYETVVAVGAEQREYRFVTAEKDVVSMLLNNLNYSFVGCRYAVTVYKCNLRERETVYQRAVTEAYFE